MEPLEKFIVESEVDSEAQSYKMVMEDIISDLNVLSSIGRIYVSVRPKESVFVMAIILRKSFSPIELQDFAEVNIELSDKKKIVLSVKSEKYLPKTLELLWSRYGKHNILQPDRRTIKIICEDSHKEIEYIKSLVIDDPQTTLKSKLLELSIRAAPEGFRVRNQQFFDSKFLFVASEENIETHWIEEAKEMLKKLEEA